MKKIPEITVEYLRREGVREVVQKALSNMSEILFLAATSTKYGFINKDGKTTWVYERKPFWNSPYRKVSRAKWPASARMVFQRMRNPDGD